MLVDSAAASWDRRIHEAQEDQQSLNRLCRQLTKKKPIVHPLLHFISPALVKKSIGKLKIKKAPGADGITNGALRYCNMRIIAAMTRLFNAILRLGYFPQAWKEGLVVTLPKPGKSPRSPGNYRPITLLSAVGKLFERLLLPLLLSHITQREEQFGFRTGHSTTLQVARVNAHASNTLNRKESAVAAFLDVSRAFDRVWHVWLLHKLLQVGSPHHVMLVLASFLRGRTFRVCVDGAIFNSHSIIAGVPQGSSLSPALYSHFTNDILVQQDTMLAFTPTTLPWSPHRSTQHTQRRSSSVPSTCCRPGWRSGGLHLTSPRPSASSSGTKDDSLLRCAFWTSRSPGAARRPI